MIKSWNHFKVVVFIHCTASFIFHLKIPSMLTCLLKHTTHLHSRSTSN